MKRIRSTDKNREPDRDDILPIEDLEPGLAIDEHALEEALQQQPDLFYRVSKALALLISERDEAKMELQTVEAEIDMEIRREAMDNDEKVTVGEVEARRRIHKKVVAANLRLIDFNKQVGQYSALKEAFQQRSYVLKSLSELYIANYYGDVQSSSGTRHMRDATAEATREDIGRRRRELK